MNNPDVTLHPDWLAMGYTLNELDDHILELQLYSKPIARFSQTSSTIDNILKEVKVHERKN